MTNDNVGLIQQGRYSLAEFVASSFFNERPDNTPIDLLVIHNISLPAGEFGTPHVQALFTGHIDCDAHASFASLQGLEVSAHFFIQRTGHVKQFVPIDKRAWHAGVSQFGERQGCNDFSIGIELEGTDTEAYTDAQYLSLKQLTLCLMRETAITLDAIVGHCDIAPGRKTDPGPSFDWQRYRQLLTQNVSS